MSPWTKRNWPVATCFVMMCCLFAKSAHAVVVAQTGFNDASGINSNGTADDPYEIGAAVDATGQGAGEPGWTTPWEAEFTDASSVIQTTPKTEGDAALAITSVGSAQNERSVYHREFTRFGGLARLSVDININDEAGNTGPTLIYMEDNDANSQDQSGVIQITGDGLIEAYDGTPRVSTGVTLSEDTWYTIEFNADFSTKTYRLSVDGTDTGSAYGFRNAAAEGFGRVTLWQATNGTSYYDNIVIDGPGFASAVVTRRLGETTGNLSLTNDGAALNIIGYSITSTEGSLDQSEWIPITGHYDALPVNGGTMGDGSVDDDDNWTILTDSGIHTDLSEAEFDGGDGGTFANGQTIDLGNVWIQSPSESGDLIVELLLGDGTVQEIPLTFAGGTDSEFVRSDLDFDNDIDEDDFVIYNSGLFVDLSSLSLAQAYQKGDLDGDGDNDFDDFDTFKTDYDAVNGSGSFEAMIAGVPEPASVVLLCLGGLAMLWGTRRRFAAALSVTLALGLATADSARALEMIAETGFNDATGINGDAVVNGFPFLDTEDLEGAGAGEAGWAGAWIRSVNNGAATIQSHTVFEGDLAMEANSAAVSGASVFKRETTAEVTGGIAQADYWFNVNDWSNGENTSFYLQHIDGVQAALVTIQTDGSIDARDGSVNGGPNSDVEVFPAGSIVDGDWYKLSIIADIDAQTFQVALDDSPPSAALNFRADLIDANVGLNAIQFWNKADSLLVDKISLSATPLDELEQIELAVNPTNGKMQLTNKFNESYSWDYYKITSEGNSLDSDAWNSLEEQDYDETGPNPGEGWVAAGGSGAGLLAETFLGESTLGPGETLTLGEGYDESADAQDLVFQYRDTATGRAVYAFVNYITPGDMNDDGAVDDADVNPFVQALTNRVAYDAAFPGVNADFVGDFDGDGVLTLGDVAGFKSAVPGIGAGSAGAVPEPASCALLLAAAIVSLARRRR